MRALVTGAGSGVGRATSALLAARGHEVIATARDTATLGDLDVAARLCLDVRDPASVHEIKRELGFVDGLVNNAAVSFDGPIEDVSVELIREMFETNVFGVVSMTAAAIPILRANRPSVVCTVTSSSIIAAVPFFSAYRASKAAASAFGDSLRVEVAPFGIRVVEIMPGPVDTDMFRLSTGEADASRFADYRAMAGVAATLRQEHADPRVVEPAAAATAVVDAILDSSGPMRYGCDPISLELLDLWRQCDDETVFTMTGSSLLDLVAAADGGNAVAG